MTDDGTHDRAGPDLEALARDWITLCQSELTALAADREMQEAWQGTMALWAAAATAMLRGWPRAPGYAGEHGYAPGYAPGPAGTAAAARTPAAASAPDAGEPAIERLLDRIADLETRLAAVERGPEGGGGDSGDGGADRPRARRG